MKNVPFCRLKTRPGTKDAAVNPALAKFTEILHQEYFHPANVGPEQFAPNQHAQPLPPFNQAAQCLWNLW